MIQLDLNASPYVGVFARANERYVLVPPSVPAALREQIGQALGVEVIEFAVGGSTIVGSVVAMNSHGALLADFADSENVTLLESLGLKVGRVAGKLNATGNNILVNDNGAYVNPDFSKAGEALVADIFNVPVEKGTLAGLKTVGSAACVTSKGVLCHPKSSDEELDFLEKLFKVESDIGTVNHGAPYIGAGISANSRGAVVGTLTTGPERNRIENALDLIG